MIEKEIADIFSRNEWTWNLKDGGKRVPSEEDVEAALDEAARLLYTEPVGTQLDVGRLIIIKKHRGFDVYCYVGPYE